MVVNEWYLTIRKNGQPVLIINADGMQATKRVIPDDSTVFISNQGITVLTEHEEIVCNWNKLRYKSLPKYKKLVFKNKQLLQIVYEIILGSYYSSYPALSAMFPFDLPATLIKYEEFSDRCSLVDFQYVLKVIRGRV